MSAAPEASRTGDVATDPLVVLLEDSRDDGDRPAYIVAEVDGELRVTLRRQPGGMPVTVRRDASGYVLTYGDTVTARASAERAERVIRGSLIPALVFR